MTKVHVDRIDKIDVEVLSADLCQGCQIWFGTKMGSDWPKMGQFRDFFFRSDSVSDRKKVPELSHLGPI